MSMVSMAYAARIVGVQGTNFSHARVRGIHVNQDISGHLKILTVIMKYGVISQT